FRTARRPVPSRGSARFVVLVPVSIIDRVLSVADERVLSGHARQGTDHLVGQLGPVVRPIRRGLDPDHHLVAVDLLEYHLGRPPGWRPDPIVEDRLHLTRPDALAEPNLDVDRSRL